MTRYSKLIRRAVRFGRTVPGISALGIIVVVGLTIGLLLSRALAGEPVYENPCIVIWHYPHYPLPGESIVSGLELAIWKDGSILVAARERLSPGQSILVGKVDPKEVEAALKQIRDAEFFDGLTGSVVVDGGSTSIHVEYAGKAATVARTETLYPGVGVNVSADSRSRALVRKWRRTRGAIEAISPIELAPLDAKIGKQTTFRGYSTDQPVTTTWRPM